MTIEKIGPLQKGVVGAVESRPTEKLRDASPTEGISFADKLGVTLEKEKVSDELVVAVREAAARVGTGELSKEQAVDFILDQLKSEPLLQSVGPARAEEIVAFVRWIFADDPVVDMLLRGT